VANEAEFTQDKKRQSGDDKRLAGHDIDYYKLYAGNRARLFPESGKDQCCNARYRGFER